MKPTLALARRRLADAKTFLTDKAQEDDGIYRDRKFVKQAGRTAYSGVIVALNAYLGIATLKEQEASLYWEALAMSDRSLQDAFQSAYNLLGVCMACDGIQDAEIVSIGLKRAQSIIDWVETRTAA